MTALVHPADLHAGQTWHYRSEFDLHVTRVEIDAATRNAAVVVSEYEFPLHIAADAWLDVDPVVSS